MIPKFALNILRIIKSGFSQITQMQKRILCPRSVNNILTTHLLRNRCKSHCLPFSPLMTEWWCIHLIYHMPAFSHPSPVKTSRTCAMNRSSPADDISHVFDRLSPLASQSCETICELARRPDQPLLDFDQAVQQLFALTKVVNREENQVTHPWRFHLARHSPSPATMPTMNF